MKKLNDRKIREIMIALIILLIPVFIITLGEGILFATSWDVSQETDESITADYDAVTGTLTISGTGRMKNWGSEKSVPWNSNAKNIQTVVIGEGITSIGSYAFYGCTSLTNIKIPSTVNSIGKYAFYNCKVLDSISIPTGITSIPDYVFYGCSSLTGITVPSTVTNIGSYCFYGCTRLTDIAIPEGVKEISNSIFYNCTSLSSVSLPSTLTTISTNAFYNCKALISVAIPAEVTSIKSEAFYACSKLEEVKFEGTKLTDIASRAFYGCSLLLKIEIPEGAKTIGEEAFFGCSKLSSITLPSTLTSIAKAAFQKCTSLNNVIIPASVKRIEANTFYGCTLLSNITFSENLTYIGDAAFYGCSKLSNILLPEEITTIGSQAFYGCSSISSLTIPDSVTSMGNEVFYNCTGLSSINLSEKITSIGTSVFYGCKNLGNITIPAGVTSIGVSAFFNCTSLMGIEIPATLNSIGNEAFSGCIALSNIVIPENENLTSIGYRVFYNCKTLYTIKIPKNISSIGEGAFSTSGLTSIEIPDSVITVGKQAFYGCTGLSKVTISDETANIGEEAFAGCTGLGTIVVPRKITALNKGIFQNCTSLSNVTLPPNLASIGQYAFSGCKTLANIAIPETVISIEGYAFENCSNLQSIIIPGKVTKIGAEAFVGCTILSNITIPNSVSNIENGIFKNCTGLTTVTIVEGGDLTSIPGEAFSGCVQLKTINLTDSITKIEKEAFKNCSGLTALQISDNVTTIGASAFEGCKKLTNITIPDGVTEIANGLFKNCEALPGITIPAGVTGIGTEAFYGCKTLQTITIPEGVAVLGNSVFYNCTALESIILLGEVTTIGNNTFYNCSTLKGIDLPETLITIGNNAFFGCTGMGNLSIPAKVTSIGDSAFKNCKSLGNIVIPNGVTKIGSSTFEGCTALGNVEISVNVTTIGAAAFKNCSSLANLIIPGNVTAIEKEAFFGCVKITEVITPDTLSTIGNSAFENCTKLETVKISKGVTSIGNYAFRGCVLLQAIDVDKENGVFSSRNGVLLNFAKTEIIYYPTGKTNEGYEVPLSVTTIDPYSFYKAIHLEKIIIPDNVKSIGTDAFDGCGNITIYCRTNSTAHKFALKEGFIEGKNLILDDDAPSIVSVTGNPTEWTEEDVTLVITAIDLGAKIPVGLSEEAYSFDGGITWQAENKKTYTQNTRGIRIQVKDALQNIVEYSEVINITKIDKYDPEITSVTGNPTTWTGNNVVLTVIANDTESGLAEAGAYSFDNGKTWQKENTKTYKENVNNIIIKVKDESQRITTWAEPINITFIDQKYPTVEVTGMQSEWTTKDITLTIKAQDAESGLAEKPYSFDGGTTWQAESSKLYTKNEYEVSIKVRDNANNITEYPIFNVDKIDKDAPVITKVVAAKASQDNNDLKLIIMAGDGDGSGLADKAFSFDGGVTWQAEDSTVVSQIGTLEIKVRDIMGNIASRTVTEDTVEFKEDEIAPIISKVSLNTTEWTGDDVIVTVTAKDDTEGIGLANKAYSFDGGKTWQVDKSKTYSQNTSGIIVHVRDAVGNTEIYTEEINITNIDKTKPTITDVTGNPRTWTRNDVTLAITASDTEAGLASKPYSFDGGKTWQGDNTKTYSTNTSADEIEIIVRDAVGNQTYYNKSVIINKIDKTKPTITSVTGNPTEWTKEDVTLTVTAGDGESGLAEKAYSFDGGVTWQISNTKTYVINTKGINILVLDAAGNFTSYPTINITKIDRAELDVKFDGYEEVEDEETKELYVTKINPKTTLAEFENKIITNGEIQIYHEEKEITESSTLLVTGMKMKVTLKTEEKEYNIVVLGDVDGNGTSDLNDILAINRYRLGKGTLTGAYLKAGDVTGDEKTNLTDILKINRYRLGKITRF